MAISRINTPIAPVAPTTTAGGLVDIYLQVHGVSGEATDMNHKEWINVESITGGVANAGAMAYGGGGGSGKSQWQDLTVQCKFEKSYPTLMQMCAAGQHIPSVRISACKAGGTQQEFMHIIMTDVIITSVNMAGAVSTEPMFDVSFNFTQIVVTGRAQTATGEMGASVMAGWDVKQNIKI
ncbi:MAG: type VI secretion system tube protein Hcp [Burkholderiaceae bacterium]|jgi:type VI secretion system secreted protein Hcp|nr:type VI secretion system tube protein Hcp [Burkholderiaceae bacterium]